MNDQIIEVEVRSVYGVDRIYPVNENAKTLARIARTKTLSPENLQAAVELGLNVKEVAPKKLARESWPCGGVTPGFGGKTFR